MIGIVITPALYAWFNISAFWDPYSNTGNIKVAVFNGDQGASSDITGSINVGAQVEEQLRDNHQLGWDFMDESAAYAAVESGVAYAAIIIPADFSRNLISITSGEFTQPTLQYYVNEKANAIAPKITDVGATQLDQQITSAFTLQVAEAAVEALKEAGENVEAGLDNAKYRSLNAFDAGISAVSHAGADVSELIGKLDSSKESIAEIRYSLEDVSDTLTDVQTAIGQAQQIAEDAGQIAVTFTDALTTAYVDASTSLADASATAQSAIKDFTGTLQQVGTAATKAIDEAHKIAQTQADILSQLEQMLEDSSLDPAVRDTIAQTVTTLKEKNKTDQKLLDDLESLTTDASTALTTFQELGDSLESATAEARDAASSMRTTLTETVPQLNAAMAALSSNAGAFSSALESQKTQLTQADELLAGLETQLTSAQAALTSLNANLSQIHTSLESTRTDIVALSTASIWGDLDKVTGLDSQQIASFISSPVEVKEDVVFPVNSYGSGMAALFTNLSLWIGAFVLMVIFKTEVDTEGFEDVTVRQAYLGRFLLFAVITIVQAIVVCVGDLVLGVQTVSAVAFVFSGIFTAITYISIIYALCVSFGHVGRGLCILLVIMQIPGASGLYPIEMMPGFFRAIYPFLPFTYGIDAMRETIAGFYDGAYWHALAVLTLFVVLSFVLGLALRRQLSHLNMMFNREIASTDLLIAEDVQVKGSQYRLADVIRALSDRSAFAKDVERRSVIFTKHYRSLIRAVALVGLVGLVILGLIAWVIPEGKATMLGTWLAWCLLIIAVLVVLEYIKQSLDMGEELSQLDEAKLRQAAFGREPRHGSTSTTVGDAS